MYKWWPKTVPEGVKMELRGKKERRYERTHKRGRRAESDSVPPSVWCPRMEKYSGMLLWGRAPGMNGCWTGMAGMGGLHLWWVLQEKKNRNFALRLRCPQLFKSKLSEWNGMKQRLLLNGKNKWNFIFQKKWPQCICTIRESGDDDWNEEGATLGCGHLSSHKKWTQFHLLFKIADVFCSIHHWGTLKLSTLVAKYWVSWVGTVLFRRSEPKWSDDSSTQYTDAMDLPHKSSIAMAPDNERGHLWWFRTKEQLMWRRGRTVAATGWLKYLLLEALEEGLTLRYSWPQILLPS